MRKRILVVGVDRDLFSRIDPLLSRSVFSVDQVARGASARDLCGRVAFDLMIVGYPLPDIGQSDFLGAVRGRESPCIGAPILVLAEERHLAEARRGLELGHDLALSVNQPRRLLEEVAARLLEVKPRVFARQLVRLELLLDPRQASTVYQTENISETGMLVRTPRPFPVGARLAFEMHLTGDRQPVQGSAEVVRHAVPDVEDMPGMGLRIETLRGDGQQRLARFLRRVARQKGQ